MMKRKLGTIAVALLALLAVSAGGAMALSMTNVTSDDMPVEDTFSVDNDTELLRVSAENLSADTADVTVYGIDSDGNESQEATATLNTSSTTSDTYEYSSIDTTLYTDYRVTVNSTGGADQIIISKLEEVTSSGGGAILSDTILTIGGVSLSGSTLGAALIVLVSALGLWYAKE